jgi:predicted nucleic acid-binding protein
MILIDSNVPMYLVGAAHPHKVDSQRALEHLLSAVHAEVGLLDVELHREPEEARRDHLGDAPPVVSFDIRGSACRLQ